MARLQKFRFLVVAFLVQALLLMPVQDVFAFAATNVPSASRSSLVSSSSQAQVGVMLPLSVQLVDRFSQPIVGHEVKLMTSSGSVSVFSSDYFTDTEGYADFMLLASEASTVQVLAMDVSSGLVLSQKAQIQFTQDAPLFLSSESGPLAGFRIEGLEDSVEVGETLSVSVTAIDSTGVTVSDYTGTVRFSSSDSQATLPNDYSFRAEDAGKHTFSLGVEFYEMGSPSLRVTDVDQFTIYGESLAIVALDSNYIASSNPGAPSSSTDSSTSADFILISPASGTFSNNNLDIQGQAEYGYTAVVYLNDEEIGRTEVEFQDNTFSYELKNLSDGDYEVFVEIVELGAGEPGEEEILSVLESSDLVEFKIDTAAPELVEISFDSEEFPAGELKALTVLSESSLDEAYVVLEGELYELSESSTPGKYEVQVPLPLDAGEYSLDVLLVDSLGNEVEHRDAISFLVSSDDEIASPEELEVETAPDAPVEGVGQTGALMARSDEERVVLSWEQAESANPIAYYRVYYGPSEDAMFAISDTLDSSNSWMVSDLMGEEIYYFAVAAVDILGSEGAKSEAVLAVPLARTSTGPADTSVDGNVPLGQTQPTMRESDVRPPATPDSGAATNGMLMLSLLGAIGYAAFKKHDRVHGN